MSSPFVITLATAGLLAGAAAAAAPIIGATLGTDSADIAAALSGESYQVSRFERFPDAISVTALKEDSRLELALDPISGAVIALSEYDPSDAPKPPGVDDAAVRVMLAEQGYAVTGYQREPGEIEVDATMDGKLWELEIDPQSGRIRAVEEEED
jgi:hypothetical protein